MHGVYGVTMKSTCDTKEVLAKLRENREKHSRIVKEAKEGYLVKAKEAIAAKLELLEKGKIVSLVFGLKMPVDHTGEYDTMIKMLEMHTQPTIELNADEVRQFVLDEWQWMQDFLVSNSPYSGTARGLSSD